MNVEGLEEIGELIEFEERLEEHDLQEFGAGVGHVRAGGGIGLLV